MDRVPQLHLAKSRRNIFDRSAKGSSLPKQFRGETCGNYDGNAVLSTFYRTSKENLLPSKLRKTGVNYYEEGLKLAQRKSQRGESSQNKMLNHPIDEDKDMDNNPSVQCLHHSNSNCLLDKNTRKVPSYIYFQHGPPGQRVTHSSSQQNLLSNPNSNQNSRSTQGQTNQFQQKSMATTVASTSAGENKPYLRAVNSQPSINVGFISNTVTAIPSNRSPQMVYETNTINNERIVLNSSAPGMIVPQNVIVRNQNPNIGFSKEQIVQYGNISHLNINSLKKVQIIEENQQESTLGQSSYRPKSALKNNNSFEQQQQQATNYLESRTLRKEIETIQQKLPNILPENYREQLENEHRYKYLIEDLGQLKDVTLDETKKCIGNLQMILRRFDQ